MIKDLAALLFRKELARMHQLYNKHSGESCYLFGDGVSLKYFDLRVFSDKKSIIGGYLPFHKDFSVLDAPYLTLIDPFYFYPLIRTTDEKRKVIRNHIQKKYRELFKEFPDKYFFVNLSNRPVVYSDNIYFHYRRLYDKRLPPEFISNHFNCFEGTLRAQILLAMYMGFENAYLVGHDYTHFPSRSLHFYERGEGLKTDLRLWNNEFFNYAGKFINITTVTLDGESETLPSVTYKSFSGRDPVFKENKEVVSSEILSLLETWPNYKI
jgi:hypothetical protein